MGLRRRYYLEAKTIPLGLCFDYAFSEAIKHIEDDSVLIVQGILDPAHGDSPGAFYGKKPYVHAWVEREGKVFDWQTMEMPSGSKYRGIGWPEDVFYSLFNPTKVKKYKAADYLALATKKKHKGPWNL